jgi:hypothetical protein
MMFDTPQIQAAGSRPDLPILQFVSFQVAPLADGGLRVSLASTFLDELNLEFLNEDIETQRVLTIDEAVSAIRRSLTEALQAHKRTEH